jgi:type I restriction enzyme S subunit
MSELVVEEELEEQGGDDLPELPAGWSVKKLKDLGTWSGGGTPSKKNESFWRNGTIPWVSPKDMKVPVLSGTQDRITDQAVQESAAKKKPANSIAVVTRSGILEHSLPVALVPFEATFNQDMKVIAPIPEVDSAWLLWVLTGGSQTILDQCRKDGTTVASIDFEKLQEFALLVPPLENQRAIAAEVEARLGEISALETELDVTEKLQTQFRQALLRDACRGDLLPVRSAGERGEVQGDILPSGWSWATLDSLAADEPRALTDGPFGSNLKSSHYTEAGPRVIRLQNIGEGQFLDEKAHISQAHFEKLSAHEARAGDVVIAILGEDAPRACRVPDNLGPAVVKADCPRLRLREGVRADFVIAALNSELVRQQAREIRHGITRPRLKLSELRRLKVPLPPPEVQDEILAGLRAGSQRAAEIESTIDGIREDLNRIQRSLLHEAFTGQLVA